MVISFLHNKQKRKLSVLTELLSGNDYPFIMQRIP